MKKAISLIALLLAAVMMTAMFAACGGGDQNPTAAADSKTATQAATAAATEAATEAADVSGATPNGTYHMVKYVEGGEDLLGSIDDVSTFDMVIDGDNSTWMGEAITLKDGKIYFTEDGENSASDYKFEGGKLIISDPEDPENNYCVFEK